MTAFLLYTAALCTIVGIACMFGSLLCGMRPPRRARTSNQRMHHYATLRMTALFGSALVALGGLLAGLGAIYALA